MSPEDFDKKQAIAEQRAAFLEYCQENELDPEDENSLDEYKEVMAETGPEWWDSQDENDVAGWTDNMNKDD